MRFVTRALALLLMLTSTMAMAQSKPDPQANATSPVPASGSFVEPNLKTPKEAAPSTSFLITSAPLPADHVLGKKGAPVVMIEYASLSCPHCAHFSNTVMPDLQKKYIDTGKMVYILRQFPLNEPALKGAMLLDCVGEENNDKYYVFAKVLFDAQNKWAFDTNYMTALETFATVGGMTKDQFSSCINSPERETKVLKAKKEANDELKVPHTPYIFIDGVPYEGDRSIEGISKYIDGRLAKK